MRTCIKILVVALLAWAASPSAFGAQGARNAPAKPIELAGINNAFHLSENIYSGSQPDGDAGFVSLKKLGIKTIVSVDGSVPDVETARKYGFRYVHLPYGYDGIPTNRVAELAKLTRALPGPFFVHCHHGMHRGPAAAAVMCEASAGWTPAQAVAWLHEAGTSADYPGLFRAARDFKPPASAELALVQSFPEITKPSSFVEAMVTVDEHFASLKQSQEAGWKTPPGRPDISPPHEATMLWEQFRELLRTDVVKKRSEDFRGKLDHAERVADSLHTAFKSGSAGASLDAAFTQVGQACAACHKVYRNP